MAYLSGFEAIDFFNQQLQICLVPSYNFMKTVGLHFFRTYVVIFTYRFLLIDFFYIYVNEQVSAILISESKITQTFTVWMIVIISVFSSFFVFSPLSTQKSDSEIKTLLSFINENPYNYCKRDRKDDSPKAHYYCSY